MIRYLMPVALTLVMAHPAFACGDHKDGKACDPKACHQTTKVGAERSAPAAAPAANAETETLKITGMSCAGCANKISKTLTQNPAITSADVSVDTGLATVTFTKGKISATEIQQLIEKAGFKAEKAKV
jgi:copper chaperone CopZ